MSSEESEDLGSIRLVRMDDIQPRHPGRVSRDDSSDEDSSEALETSVVDDGDVMSSVIDDDDSNIGSMVSIRSEDVTDEMIVPEVLESQDGQELVNEAVEDFGEAEPEADLEQFLKSDDPVQPTQEMVLPKPLPPGSWPTLEILPGGVINHIGDKIKPKEPEKKVTNTKMMYACAKCSQSFRHLFCLVKHVKWHEDEDKRRTRNLTKPIPIDVEPELMKQRILDRNTTITKQKLKLVAPKVTKAATQKKYICLRAKKRVKKVTKKIIIT